MTEYWYFGRLVRLLVLVPVVGGIDDLVGHSQSWRWVVAFLGWMALEMPALGYWIGGSECPCEGVRLWMDP